MTFLAVGWLALLVPWAAAVAWLWRRDAAERGATATFLWPPGALPPTRARVRRRPPAWIVAALLALLAAIVALSGPATRGRATRLAVVVDPFASMSATVDGRTRLASLIDRAEAAIAAAGVRVTLDVRVAGRPDAQPDLAAARSIRFTARRTDAAVAPTLEAALGANDVAVVLTDKRLTPRDGSDGVVIDPARVAILVPPVVDNAGIERAVAVATPTPRLMVRLANFGDATEAALVVRVGGATTRVPTTLPARGGRTNVFVDLPAVGERIDVTLERPDALPIDDAAALLPDGGWPRLVVDGDLPRVAGRFAAAHARERPADPDAADVWLTAGDAPAGVVAIRFAAATRAIAPSTPRLADHPILRDVGLDAVAIDRVAEPPGGEWTTVADVGGAPILAVRERPTRGVWIGFAPDERDVGSVVLLGNAVAWLRGDAPRAWTAATPDAVGRDWTAIDVDARVDSQVDAGPGAYRDPTGRAVSVHVPAIAPGGGRDVGDAAAFVRAAARDRARPLGPYVTVVAAALAALAGVLAGRASRRRGES